MISRRTLLAAGALPMVSFARPHAPVGLELYSLRERAQKDLPETLALVRRFGFHEIEVEELHGKTPREFRHLLDDHGLKATSMMAPYDKLLQDAVAVGAEARELGAEYVVCSTIPHRGKYLDEEAAQQAADKLNRWGAQLAKARLHCCYHTHGTEFQKLGEGTVFDLLLQSTDRRYANFEMDIFWIAYSFQDPAAMLRRYPGRFPLMHLKDIRKGTKLGLTPADVAEEDSVSLGQGIVNIAETLRAARETGVRHYYIEDEAMDAAAQLPASLAYLEGIGFSNKP